MKLIKVKVTFNEKVLGSQSNNKEIHADYIASKSPDKKSKEEEIAAVGIEAYEEKTMTVFPRMADGTPMFWDYQIRGFFKDSCSALQRCKGEEISKERGGGDIRPKTRREVLSDGPTESPNRGKH